MKYHQYSVYGFKVSSSFELPELMRAEFASADVEVLIGDVPETLEKATRKYPWVEYGDKVCLLKADGVARFLVEDGCKITIDRRIDRSNAARPGAPAADVRVYLLGSAFGALIHQRQWLPLHISAVKSPKGGVAFTGNSGDGKSTLAGWLHREYQWALVSDDVSVIKPGEDQAMIYPGPRKLKLWDDAVHKLGCEDENLVHDLSNTPKFQLYLPDSDRCEPSLLKDLVILSRSEGDEKAKINKLKGSQAFLACRFALYRPYMSVWFRDQAKVLQDLAELAERVSIYRFQRSWDMDHFESQLHPLLVNLIGEDNLGSV